MKLTRQSVVRCKTTMTPALEKALGRMKRDIAMVLLARGPYGDPIELVKKELPAEHYEIVVSVACITIYAGDDLGFIFGLLEVSRRFLKIEPFWFWNDQVFDRRLDIMVPSQTIESPEYRVKYRGWFINDEVLIHKWSLEGDSEKPWEMVMEALLRCGGNMVIPGTDKNSKIYCRLAEEMGLWVTHHHAEPLGAEMFSRAYPDKFPSYTQYPELFQGLWRQAIEKQKHRRTIWNIGFRGQGDYPFWNNDPAYDTPEKRGALISSLMKLQYDMVREQVPDAICCTNLYGEIMELYQQGFIDIPEDVIRIWADNGFGKMVSRRQGNHNPRVPALPEDTPEEHQRAHGIYYHASFYDLQAASHITMLPNSMELVGQELKEAFRRGADDYLIVNCSNVKPHIYTLDYIRKLWLEGEADPAQHALDYAKTYFGEDHAEAIAALYQVYPECTVKYGPNEDDRAGEQFYTYPTRVLAHAWMLNRVQKHCDELTWMAEGTYREQLLWYLETLKGGREGLEKLLKRCEAVAGALKEGPARLFKDSLMLQVTLHRTCLEAGIRFCEAFLEFEQKNYKKAFIGVGAAAELFAQANQAMCDREHDKWEGFYMNECLADVKFAGEVLRGLMAHIRAIGDGPHYYVWMREYLYSEEDLRISLITNMENHMTDQELYELMKTKADKEDATLFPGMLIPG